ncbi:MAG: hypothetical protein WHU93_05850 [Arcobacteraceae bacterium]
MKWVLIILGIALFIALILGYRGGAQDAASNYNKLLRPQETQK